jgi:hypothetical protein
MSFLDTVKTKMVEYKMRILAISAVSLVTLVQYASAADLNASIYPILTDVSELFIPLLALIVAAVPVIIAISVISFILGIFAAILSKLNI